QESQEFDFFDPGSLSTAALQTGPFHISLDSRDDSIDSFYYPKGKLVWKKRLLVFHTKDVSMHPVSGQAIVIILDKLELLEKALKSPRSVRLIFVVPTSDEYKREHKQLIQWDSLSNAQSVDIIPGVGRMETNQLKTIDVETVKDLRTAVDGPSAQQRSFFSAGALNQYSMILKGFDEHQESVETMLAKIPQYVWKM
ncbi:hypothetical protein L914_02804, partial [Phytophthora nicotianae]